jgi:hypothetical protein
MEVGAIMEFVTPIIGLFGLLVFTHGVGRLVATPVRGDAARDAQVRKAAMFFFWIFFFVSFLEPRLAWVQLAAILVAVLCLVAVFSAPLRRTLFRPNRSEQDAA